MKDSYWFCHGILQSKARAYYGSIYNLPEDLGEFDFVYYGMILTHLRDPYHALWNGARLSKDYLVITGIWDKSEKPTSTFRPAPDRYSNLNVKGWWLLSCGTIKAMAGTMGFPFVKSMISKAKVVDESGFSERTCEALVFRRV